MTNPQNLSDPVLIERLSVLLSEFARRMRTPGWSARQKLAFASVLMVKATTAANPALPAMVEVLGQVAWPIPPALTAKALAGLPFSVLAMFACTGLTDGRGGVAVDPEPHEALLPILLEQARLKLHAIIEAAEKHVSEGGEGN